MVLALARGKNLKYSSSVIDNLKWLLGNLKTKYFNPVTDFRTWLLNKLI